MLPALSFKQDSPNAFNNYYSQILINCNNIGHSSTISIRGCRLRISFFNGNSSSDSPQYTTNLSRQFLRRL